jgi:hypothetical protein
MLRFDQSNILYLSDLGASLVSSIDPEANRSRSHDAQDAVQRQGQEAAGAAAASPPSALYCRSVFLAVIVCVLWRQLQEKRERNRHRRGFGEEDEASPATAEDAPPSTEIPAPVTVRSYVRMVA